MTISSVLKWITEESRKYEDKLWQEIKSFQEEMKPSETSDTWNKDVRFPGAKPFTFDEYQKRTKDTAIYPSGSDWDPIIPILYTALGLSGEVGECCDKIKKILRDDRGFVTEEKVKILSKELGDVCWYLSQLCTELGLSMSDVAQQNLDKLAKRKEKGTLQGSGDDR